MQAGFCALLGWETLAEKDAGFSMTARALGVEICLAESHLGLARDRTPRLENEKLQEKSHLKVARPPRTSSPSVDVSFLPKDEFSAGPPVRE